MGHRILAAGEVLWDLLPDGKQLGGAGEFHVSLPFSGCSMRVW